MNCSKLPNHTNNQISIETDGTQKQEQVIITSISTAGSLSDFDFRVLNFRVFQELPWRPHPGDSRFDSSKCFTVDVSSMFELCLFLCGDFVRVFILPIDAKRDVWKETMEARVFLFAARFLLLFVDDFTGLDPKLHSAT